MEKLQHGWFVVRNRSTQEIQEGVTIAERHKKESTFFKAAPWNQLPKERVGVKALQRFLGQLLYEHIRREFPALVKEIEDLYAETQRKLEALGSSRQTPSQQRQYLTRLANRYQRNVEDALRGNYAPELDVKSKLKLRMHLRELADQFERDIRTQGHTLPFKTADGSIDDEYLDSDIEQEHPDIMQWIRERYRDARGAELPGTVNPALLVNLFRQQTVKWREISESYLDQTAELIKEYTRLECRRTESDDTVRSTLECIITSQIESTEAAARLRLMDMLNDERGGILQTVNHYFAETLEKIRKERVIARFKRMGIQDGLNPVDLNGFTDVMHLSNEDQAVLDIHDVLKAYYKVALKRFEDYTVVSVVERMLGDQQGLKFFSPEHVGSLSDVQLAEIAAENYTTSAARTELEHRCERYRQALQVAKSL